MLTNHAARLVAARSSSCIAMRQKSTTPLQREVAGERQKSAWELFAANAQAIGIATTIIAATSSMAYFTASVTRGLKKDLELAEQRAEKDLELSELRAKEGLEQAELRAKKDLELAEQRAKVEVAMAKMETAERFLQYGYAAEFERYQKQVDIHKGEHDTNHEES